MLGGEHGTAVPEHVLGTSPFDVVVLGEGEETFVELLRAPLLRGELPSVSLFGAGMIFTAAFAGMAMLTIARFEKKIIFQL